MGGNEKNDAAVGKPDGGIMITVKALEGFVSVRCQSPDNEYRHCEYR